MDCQLQTTKKALLGFFGQVNFRELGGYQTTEGRTIRWDVYGSFENYIRDGLELNERDIERLKKFYFE